MWLVFDQRYRNNYTMAGGIYPRQRLPRAWFDVGIAHRADDPGALARALGVTEGAFTETFRTFNGYAENGQDLDFARVGKAPTTAITGTPL